MHNEGKSIIPERFIRTLKNKFYKYMSSVSKTVYIDKLDNKATVCWYLAHRQMCACSYSILTLARGN